MPTVLADSVAAPIIVNQFPAKVLTPTGDLYDKTRAIITLDLLVVYAHVGRRVETVIGSGVVLMLNDLAGHVGMDREVGITVEVSREQHNVMTVDRGVQYIPGLETYNVTYKAPDGREWHNGVPEERWKV